jgi:hypothetical protein
MACDVFSCRFQAKTGWVDFLIFQNELEFAIMWDCVCLVRAFVYYVIGFLGIVYLSAASTFWFFTFGCMFVFRPIRTLVFVW